MHSRRISATGPVGLIGASPQESQAAHIIAQHVDLWVGVDGGADRALDLGLDLAAVYGDLDSLSEAARAAFAARLCPVTEQDTTDFDKALRHVDAPLVLACGLSGGRLDHELAVLSSLLAHEDRPCVVVSDSMATVLCPPQLALDLPPGVLVSLFPMRPVGVASTGLRWPTEGLTLAPGARIGTSNESLGPVSLRPEGPSLLLLLSVAQLGALIAALLAAPRWP